MLGPAPRRAGGLPPTSPDLLDLGAKPYFLWWTDLTVGELLQKLKTAGDAERGYYLGALLREGNTRDVWLFTSPEEVRDLWPHLVRHLGKSRERWTWLLDLPDPNRNRETAASSA